MPRLRIGMPNCRILFDRVVLIVLRVDDDRKQHQIFAQDSRKTFLEFSQVIGKAEAVRGIGAADVGKAQSYDFAIELRKYYFVSGLVGQSKVRYSLLQVQDLRCGGRIRKFAYDGKPPCL